MSKGLWQKVLAFMGIQEEDEEEWEEREAVPAEAPRATTAAATQRGRLVSLPTGGAKPQPMRVTVVEPRSFEEVQQIADFLKERRAVIVSLEQADRELSQRIIDFISGTTYALDGSIQRIGEAIFLCAPSHVAVEGGLTPRWQEAELPPPSTGRRLRPAAATGASPASAPAGSARS